MVKMAKISTRQPIMTCTMATMIATVSESVVDNEDDCNIAIYRTVKVGQGSGFSQCR